MYYFVVIALLLCQFGGMTADCPLTYRTSNLVETDTIADTCSQNQSCADFKATIIGTFGNADRVTVNCHYNGTIIPTPFEPTDDLVFINDTFGPCDSLSLSMVGDYIYYSGLNIDTCSDDPNCDFHPCVYNTEMCSCSGTIYVLDYDNKDLWTTADDSQKDSFLGSGSSAFGQVQLTHGSGNRFSIESGSFVASCTQDNALIEINGGISYPAPIAHVAARYPLPCLVDAQSLWIGCVADPENASTADFDLKIWNLKMTACEA